MKLKAGSGLIHAGTSVGLTYDALAMFIIIPLRLVLMSIVYQEQLIMFLLRAVIQIMVLLLHSVANAIKGKRIYIFAGDHIYFHCGDTFRCDVVIHNSGSSGAPITYSSYGTGAKPKLLGSSDVSSTNAWSNVSGNIWKTTATIGTTMDDVANLIFNNEASCGVKMETQATCVTQGQWYYNPSTNYIYIYSSGNPG